MAPHWQYSAGFEQNRKAGKRKVQDGKKEKRSRMKNVTTEQK